MDNFKFISPSYLLTEPAKGCLIVSASLSRGFTNFSNFFNWISIVIPRFEKCKKIIFLGTVKEGATSGSGHQT